MTGGKAHGPNRQYQVECRDVLLFRSPELTSWVDDGIDVRFDLPDTRWTIDIALRKSTGALVVAECRRKAGDVKQEEVAAFAYKVEQLRKHLNLPVAGFFFAKKGHQTGAVRVAQFNGIQVMVLESGAAPPGFTISFLRYDSEREQKCRDIAIHVPTGSLRLAGGAATLIHRKADGETEIR